jgi:hypothetical protein
MLISGLEFELPLHAFLSHDTIHPVYGTPSYLKRYYSDLLMLLGDTSYYNNKINKFKEH